MILPKCSLTGGACSEQPRPLTCGVRTEDMNLVLLPSLISASFQQLTSPTAHHPLAFILGRPTELLAELRAEPRPIDAPVRRAVLRAVGAPERRAVGAPERKADVGADQTPGALTDRAADERGTDDRADAACNRDATTAAPTQQPTRHPTTVLKTTAPTQLPTQLPTAAPTTDTPTQLPTQHPTQGLSYAPSGGPSTQPERARR